MKEEKNYVAYNEYLRSNQDSVKKLADYYFTLKGKKITGLPKLGEMCLKASTFMVGSTEVKWPCVIIEKFMMPAAAASESAYVAQTMAVYGSKGWAGNVPGGLRFSLPILVKYAFEGLYKANFKPETEKKETKPQAKKENNMPEVRWNLRLGRGNNLLGDPIAKAEGLDNKFVITVKSSRTGTFVYRANYPDYKSARKIFDKMNAFMKSGKSPNLKEAWVSVADLKSKLSNLADGQKNLFV